MQELRMDLLQELHCLDDTFLMQKTSAFLITIQFLLWGWL